MIYITSDLHLGHTNIIRLCGRQFSSIEEMDEKLISNMNRRVYPNDELWILGDFCFRNSNNASAYLRRINGKKHLIIGNHDSEETIKAPEWSSVQHYKELKYNHQKLIMFHYPMLAWNGSFHGSMHLFGHEHGNLSKEIIRPRSMDVGVDSNNFMPWSIDEIFEYMTKEWLESGQLT